jgi:hypothetical protein
LKKKWNNLTLYHRAEGDLPEGTVMLLVMSPLLAIAGFYDPPFKIAAKSVELLLDDGEELLRGRIGVTKFSCGS